MLTNKDHLDMAPPGWDKLVRSLDMAISLIYPEYEIIQVKEKFGMLRYYVDFSSMDDDTSLKVSDLITSAEQASINICQNCGTHYKNIVASNPLSKITMGMNALCTNCRR